MVLGLYRNAVILNLCGTIHALRGFSWREVANVVIFLFYPTPLYCSNKLARYITALYKKGQMRLYLLRKLRSFGVQGALLRTFCDTVVTSSIFYGICLSSNISDMDRKRLDKLIKKAYSVLGCITTQWRWWVKGG